MYQDRSGTLWGGTRYGLNRLIPGRDREGAASPGYFMRYHYDAADPHSLSNDAVNTIFEDHEGTLWIGTEEGVLWLGLGGAGLQRLDRTTGASTFYVLACSVRSAGPLPALPSLAVAPLRLAPAPGPRLSVLAHRHPIT